MRPISIAAALSVSVACVWITMRGFALNDLEFAICVALLLWVLMWLAEGPDGPVTRATSVAQQAWANMTEKVYEGFDDIASIMNDTVVPAIGRIKAGYDGAQGGGPSGGGAPEEVSVDESSVQGGTAMTPDQLAQLRLTYRRAGYVLCKLRSSSPKAYTGLLAALTAAVSPGIPASRHPGEN